MTDTEGSTTTGGRSLASRSGFMTHDEATRGPKLFAREVLPRLRERPY